jgi:intracellular multiplication protein IcmV
MGVWSGVKKGLDFVFYIRPKEWISWNYLKASSMKTYGLVKDIYTIPKTGRIETFAQAIRRHQLSQEDLHNIKTRYLYQCFIYLMFAFGLLLYCIDALYHSEILRAFGTLSLICLLLSYAFRSHFFYFQITRGKLGCSFYEWLDFLRNGA